MSHSATHHVMCSTTINLWIKLGFAHMELQWMLQHSMVAITRASKFYCDNALLFVVQTAFPNSHPFLASPPSSHYRDTSHIPVFLVPHSLQFWHPSRFVECEWSPGIFGAAYRSSLTVSQTPPANSGGPKQHSTAHQKQKALLEVHKVFISFNCRQWSDWFKHKSTLSGHKVIARLCITLRFI